METTVALLWFIVLFFIVLYVASTVQSSYEWCKNNQTLLLVTLILTFSIAFILMIMSWWSSENEIEDEFKSEDTQDTTVDSEGTKVTEIYDDSIPEDKILISEVPDTGSLLTTVTWEQFKKLSTEPAFHSKFAEAVKECCKIKKTKYLKFLNSLKKEQNGGLLNSLNGNVQSPESRISSTISEIQKIIPLIDSQILNVSANQIENRMAKVIKLGETLVAREEVKDLIAQRLYVFCDNPRVFLNHFQNICFLGPSGVGKTKLAETISEIFATSGILVRNNFVSKTGDEFVTGYVGESGPLTRKMLMQSLEGVLFIDEAYSIAPEKGMFVTHNHGKQAIDAMVNHLDKTLGLSFVIAAGYKRDMESRFLGANEGMPRRFPHRIELEQYTPDQLFQLSIRFLQKDKIILPAEGKQYLYSAIEYINVNHPKLFERQAGDLLNLTEKIAHYTFSSASANKEYKKIISEAIYDFAKNQDTTLRLNVD